jgi:hypothetical protein
MQVAHLLAKAHEGATYKHESATGRRNYSRFYRNLQLFQPDLFKNNPAGIEI